MKVSQVMTRAVGSIHPDATLQRAASMMGELDTEMLPVCDHGRLVGVITDRDLAVRATARGLSPHASLVGDVMSGRVVWCTENQDIDDVVRHMDAEGLSRLPVLGGGRAVIGVVARRELLERQVRSGQATKHNVAAALGDLMSAGHTTASPGSPQDFEAGGQ